MTASRMGVENPNRGPHGPAANRPTNPRGGLDRQCIRCGQPLTMQQAVSGKVCDNLACRGPYLQELHAADVARKRAERSRIAEQVKRQVRMADLLAVVLPANLHACVPLSPERLESFRSHLRRVIAEAQPPDGGEPGTPASPEDGPNTEPPPAAVIHGCTTCRGRCCLGGAGHAFLRAERLTQFWQQHPTWSPEEIEAEYLGHVAPASFAGSCIYHSESGCSLPRTMRATICNTFLCEELLQGLEHGPDLSLYIAADGAEVHRAVFVDAEGRRNDLLPSESAMRPESQ